ncbi:MbtH family protein [Catenulispora pinisilvae]|uniref:MbtH family protein n=1 Tax=Catenulispora pinisilvae TaxID=2705253 RepID=UPI001891A66D|nr:MbtH family protein [Catenulispora pinisilvae]
MVNPFEDQDAEFIVLVNVEGQHSLWPASITVPVGWDRAFGAADRAACLDYVRDNWTDMRPLSLIQAKGDVIKKQA